VVNLKRFKFEECNILKNNDIITVSFDIDLNSQHYELFAFVLHCESGTADTGHYKAYINCNTEWFEFDDDKVRMVNPVELVKFASQGYYYCYRRINEA